MRLEKAVAVAGKAKVGGHGIIKSSVTNEFSTRVENRMKNINSLRYMKLVRIKRGSGKARGREELGSEVRENVKREKQ